MKDPNDATKMDRLFLACLDADLSPDTIPIDKLTGEQQAIWKKMYADFTERFAINLKELSTAGLVRLNQSVLHELKYRNNEYWSFTDKGRDDVKKWIDEHYRETLREAFYASAHKALKEEEQF